MQEQDMEYYGVYANALQEAEKMILGELEDIIHSVSAENEHSPAEHIRSRIKSAGSIQEKLRRNGQPTDAENALKFLSDAVGVRVVTHFIGDVYVVLEKIKTSSMWTVANVKDYISNPKPNGYRSLHVILEIPFAAPSMHSIRAEIQLRTIAMDCWASLEHQMKYKKDIPNTALIVEELRRCAEEMASTDLTMQTIRELIQSENNNEEEAV